MTASTPTGHSPIATAGLGSDQGDQAGGDSADLAGELHRLGFRATRQRVDILRLVKSLQHPTAEMVWCALGSANVAVATVYRALQALEVAGVVESDRFGNGPLIYHAAGQERHDHLVCEHCGTLVDLNTAGTDPLREVVTTTARDRPFTIARVLVTAVGACDTCQVTKPVDG